MATINNNCGLLKYKKITILNYIGRTGKKYPFTSYEDRERYARIANEDFPFTIEYGEEPLFLCCKLCNCNK